MIPNNFLISQQLDVVFCLNERVFSSKKDVLYFSSREKPLALYVFSKNNETVDFLRKNTSSGQYVVNDVLMQFAGMYIVYLPCILGVTK